MMLMWIPTKDSRLYFILMWCVTYVVPIFVTNGFSIIGNTLLWGIFGFLALMKCIICVHLIPISIPLISCPNVLAAALYQVAFVFELEIIWQYPIRVLVTRTVILFVNSFIVALPILPTFNKLYLDVVWMNFWPRVIGENVHDLIWGSNVGMRFWFFPPSDSYYTCWKPWDMNNLLTG